MIQYLILILALCAGRIEASDSLGSLLLTGVSVFREVHNEAMTNKKGDVLSAVLAVAEKKGAELLEADETTRKAIIERNLGGATIPRNPKLRRPPDEQWAAIQNELYEILSPANTRFRSMLRNSYDDAKIKQFMKIAVERLDLAHDLKEDIAARLNLDGRLILARIGYLIKEYRCDYRTFDILNALMHQDYSVPISAAIKALEFSIDHSELENVLGGGRCILSPKKAPTTFATTGLEKWFIESSGEETISAPTAEKVPSNRTVQYLTFLERLKTAYEQSAKQEEQMRELEERTWRAYSNALENADAPHYSGEGERTQWVSHAQALLPRDHDMGKISALLSDKTSELYYLPPHVKAALQEASTPVVEDESSGSAGAGGPSTPMSSPESTAASSSTGTPSESTAREQRNNTKFNRALHGFVSEETIMTGSLRHVTNTNNTKPKASSPQVSWGQHMLKPRTAHPTQTAHRSPATSPSTQTPTRSNLNSSATPTLRKRLQVPSEIHASSSIENLTSDELPVGTQTPDALTTSTATPATEENTSSPSLPAGESSPLVENVDREDRRPDTPPASLVSAENPLQPFTSECTVPSSLAARPNSPPATTHSLPPLPESPTTEPNVRLDTTALASLAQRRFTPPLLLTNEAEADRYTKQMLKTLGYSQSHRTTIAESRLLSHMQGALDGTRPLIQQPAVQATITVPRTTFSMLFPYATSEKADVTTPAPATAVDIENAPEATASEPTAAETTQNSGHVEPDMRASEVPIASTATAKREEGESANSVPLVLSFKRAKRKSRITNRYSADHPATDRVLWGRIYQGPGAKYTLIKLAEKKRRALTGITEAQTELNASSHESRQAATAPENQVFGSAPAPLMPPSIQELPSEEVLHTPPPASPRAEGETKFLLALASTPSAASSTHKAESTWSTKTRIAASTVGLLVVTGAITIGSVRKLRLAVKNLFKPKKRNQSYAAAKRAH